MQTEYANQKRTAASLDLLLNMSRRVAQSDSQPPSPEEAKQLIAYLREQGMNPVVIGSAAIVGHLQLDANALENEFRPTSDLDILVKNKRMPTLPYGWKLDTSAIGVTCWISPTGGSVDFVQVGQQLPNGKNVSKVDTDSNSADDYPLANVESIFKLKLNSSRQRDLEDLLVLAKHKGVPPLTGLNSQQRENLEYLNLIISSSSQS